MEPALFLLLGAAIVCLWFLLSAIRIVPDSARLVVLRLGRLYGLKGPGLVLVFPVVDRTFKVELPQLETMAEAILTTMRWAGEPLTYEQVEAKVTASFPREELVFLGAFLGAFLLLQERGQIEEAPGHRFCVKDR